MSAFTNIVLLDGQPTPVSRTFTAKAEIDNRFTWWAEEGLGIALAYPSITTRTVFARNPNGATKHECVIRVPIVDTSTPGSPKLSHFHQVSITVTTADRGTLAERSNLHAYAKNFLASARFLELVRDLDPPR